MAHSIEALIRIYDDECGDYIEVRPDSDSLGLVEIISVDANNPKDLSRSMTMCKEQAKLLSEALQKITEYNLDIK